MGRAQAKLTTGKHLMPFHSSGLEWDGGMPKWLWQLNESSLIFALHFYFFFVRLYFLFCYNESPPCPSYHLVASAILCIVRIHSIVCYRRFFLCVVIHTLVPLINESNSSVRRDIVSKVTLFGGCDESNDNSSSSSKSNNNNNGDKSQTIFNVKPIRMLCHATVIV